MKKIFRSLGWCLLIGWCHHFTVLLPAQDEGSMESSSSVGVGFVTVCNGTGMEDKLRVRVNGRNPVSGDGFVSGDDTGQMGFSAGKSVRVEVGHPLCNEPAEVILQIKNEENLILVAYATEKVDPETAGVTYDLRIGRLPNKPSPGECRITFFACDPNNKVGAVVVNGTTLELPPLKPVGFLAEVEDSLAVKGVNGGELEPYLLADPEHYYCVVFPTIGEESSIQGTWFVDEKISYSAEEESKARQFVQDMALKERLAQEKWEAEQRKRLEEFRKNRNR